MPLLTRLENDTASRGFAAWRIVVWLILLLAAFGCVQYLGHMQLLWGHRHGLSATDSATLHGMLAWDVAYFAGAFVLIVLCAGCILRQAWARTPMRIACGVLALWALVSGVMMLRQWSQFDQASADALAQLAGDPRLQQAVAQARRVYRITLGMKAVAIPLLLWLAWRLGTPAARQQFRHRR